MQTDSVAARAVRLVATDLDGTLIGSANEFPLYTVFRDRINDLRRRNNAVWVACTGRNLRSFWAFFSPMRTMGLLPDYVVLRHAYIYKLTRFGYLPHIFWNLHIRHQLLTTRFYVRRAITEWHHMITGGSLGVKTLNRERNRLRLCFDSEKSAETAAGLLRERVKPYRHLMVFQYFREVDVKGVPFTKGLAVKELAAHLDVTPDNVLAIGNGHNDISMLEGSVARYTGCPSNSEPEVVEAVHQIGGHVSAKRSLSGVLDIMDAVASGSVRSELPPGWVSPAQGPNPESQRKRQRNPRRVRRRSGWLIAAALYSVLVTFAAFDVIPFSGWIMKPFTLMALAFEKLLGLFYG